MLILSPPREHGPAHVHVLKGSGAGESEVVFELGQPIATGMEWNSIRLREVEGMRQSDVVIAARLVQRHLILLRERWIAIHGET